MKKIILAAVLAGAATTASADALIYAGANIGQSDIDGHTGTATGFHVGTGILPIIGVEAGYNHHGKINGVNAHSTFFALKPSIDLGPLHIYGKAGIHQFKGEKSGYSTDGTDTMYGLGVEYSVLPMITVGGGYQSFKVEGGNINSFNLTATFHFL
ncbi:outer membrane beta-barrel protein [Vibrio sp. SCSIO 43136]|uniref:outer membrane beta-barrel protein n=1 Tax=Vibrio sp. SCSIO 43136 TaxID=2819101 RepID=UPI002076074B|nr:outer membrane beta-barrel protein [Vibrio sp. SCSIO 43136]USD66460.1 porin family protein [Vibrio sp. SCSIO 43136]